MPEEEEEKKKRLKKDRVWRQGTQKTGKVKLWMVKRRSWHFGFYFFPVFICAAAQFLRNWARGNCGGRGEKISKMADKQRGRGAML